MTLQLTTGPRPQPVERFGQAPACMCRYDLRPVDGIPGTHQLDPFREGWRRGVYAFRIHPGCPHHGDGNRLVVVERRGDYDVLIEPRRPWLAIDDPRRPWVVLDDDERRGH